MEILKRNIIEMGWKKCKIWQVHQNSVHVNLHIFAHNMPQNRNLYVNNSLDILTEGFNSSKCLKFVYFSWNFAKNDGDRGSFFKITNFEQIQTTKPYVYMKANILSFWKIPNNTLFTLTAKILDRQYWDIYF